MSTLHMTASSTPPTPEEVKGPDFNSLIIGQYISRYAPADEYGQGVILATTADIIADLADMADLSPDDVNAVMTRLGFIPGHNNSGSFGWLLRCCSD